MVGGCEMQQADVAETRTRDQGVSDWRKVEEWDGGRRGRGGDGGSGDLMEDLGTWFIVSACRYARQAFDGPSTTSKVAKKIALSMIRLRGVHLPRRQ